MPNLKELADQMDAVLAGERRECKWDHPTYSRSRYVYVSKKGMEKLDRLISFVNDLAAHYAKVDEAYGREMQLHAAALQELTRVADESEQHAGELAARMGIINDSARKIHHLMALLARMRNLFGGSVKDPKEVGVLLEEVDKVLK